MYPALAGYALHASKAGTKMELEKALLNLLTPLLERLEDSEGDKLNMREEVSAAHQKNEKLRKTKGELEAKIFDLEVRLKQTQVYLQNAEDAIRSANNTIERERAKHKADLGTARSVSRTYRKARCR